MERGEWRGEDGEGKGDKSKWTRSGIEDEWQG